MFHNKALNEITRADLDALVANEVSEGRGLDYKRDLAFAKDADKKELARDIAAFANAAGGDLIFGIEEGKDSDGKNHGKPSKILGVAENFDAAKLVIESVIASTIEPRVQGIQFAKVDGFERGPVILIRVPRSWNAPHMVTSSTPAFYTRTNSGKRSLDVHEIRSAFIAGTETATRIRRFRDERVGRIVANDTPVPLYDLPRVVIHVVPLREHLLNPPAVEKGQPYMRPMTGQSFSHRFNVDGFVTYAHAPEGADSSSYCQAFRDGALEAVTAAHAHRHSSDGRTVVAVYPLPIERDTVQTLQLFMQILAAHDYDGPVSVMMTLVQVKGAILEHGLSFSRFPGQTRAFDRDVVVLPDVLVEEMNVDLRQHLRPLFDALWQAGGYERSYGYDEDGKWRALAQQRS